MRRPTTWARVPDEVNGVFTKCIGPFIFLAGCCAAVVPEEKRWPPAWMAELPSLLWPSGPKGGGRRWLITQCNMGRCVPSGGIISF